MCTHFLLQTPPPCEPNQLPKLYKSEGLACQWNTSRTRLFLSNNISNYWSAFEAHWSSCTLSSGMVCLLLFPNTTAAIKKTNNSKLIESGSHSGLYAYKSIPNLVGEPPGNEFQNTRFWAGLRPSLRTCRICSEFGKALSDMGWVPRNQSYSTICCFK